MIVSNGMRAHIEACFTLMLEKDGKNIGQCFFQTYNTGYILYGLFVEKEYRGQGAGKELILAAQKKLDRDIYLKVDPFDTEGLNKDQLTSFYRKLGFAEHSLKDYMKWSYSNEENTI
jgi:GNAT superfamily N-acetyltransferase